MARKAEATYGAHEKIGESSVISVVKIRNLTENRNLYSSGLIDFLSVSKAGPAYEGRGLRADQRHRNITSHYSFDFRAEVFNWTNTPIMQRGPPPPASLEVSGSAVSLPRAIDV